MRIFCNKWRQQLLREQDNELDAESLAQLRAHLKTCAGCRAERDLLHEAYAATAILRRQRASAVAPANLPKLVMAAVTFEPDLDLLKAEGVDSEPDSDSGSVWMQPGRQRSLRYASALLLVFLVVTLIFVYRAVGLSLTSTAGTGSFTPATTAAVAAKVTTEAHDSGAFTTGGILESAPGGVQGTTPMTFAGIPTNATAAGTTRKETRAAGTTAATAGATTTATTSAGYRLYTGSLTELDKLVKAGEQFGMQPQLLSNAAALRILTSPADPELPVRKAVVLAGYPLVDARAAVDSFRSTMPVDNTTTTVELVPPGDQQLLVDIFGKALYEQLLPTEKERELTYVMITIGG